MAELDALNDVVDEVRAAGAEIVAVSPQIEKHGERVVAKLGLAFPLLRDEGNAIAAEYGLRYAFPDDLRELYTAFKIDLAEVNGEPSWTLPMPARYVVGADGVIKYARVHPDYTQRPEPAETVAALRAIDA
ncbi:MAG: redoxin domain-containing protein [Planctomycetota bacterium]|jgi:peroxiredoxin